MVRNYQEIDREIIKFLLSNKGRKDYEDLFKCFLHKYLTFAIPEKSLASYPGYSSLQGILQDDIEGFYRILPVMAAWVYSGRDPLIDLYEFGRVHIGEIVFDGITNATIPSSQGYYMKIGDYDGRTIAASVIALSLYLLKDTLLKRLSRIQLEKIAEWLNGVNGRRVVDNNWHLYVVLTNGVLKRLGMPYSERDYREHYLRFKSFYRGNGWYSDSPGQVFDWYNAWVIHPYLIWIDEIDPALDRIFIREKTKAFLKNFIYFFSPQGFPIFGRSVCYRMALPTPLLLAEAFGWSPVNSGQAKRAMNVIWEYFLRNGAVKNGLITQGYHGDNLDFLDGYSGPASCNWSLMSLAALFTININSDFWKIETEPLPVELSSYELRLKDIQMTVVGNKHSGNIEVHLTPPKKFSSTKIVHYSIVAKFVDKILNWLKIKETKFWKILPYRLKSLTYRPSNEGAKYGLGKYSSNEPFCGSN